MAAPTRPFLKGPAVTGFLIAALVVSGCTTRRSTQASAKPSVSTTIVPTTTKDVVPRRRATIVLVVPAAGPNASLGAEALTGLELALRHGVEDKRLPADTAMNIRVLDESAKGLARAVDRVVRDEKVIAIFGGLTEDTEGVLAPIARRRKVALFSFAWRVGSEPADAMRVGPDPTALVAVTAAALRASNVASNAASNAASSSAPNAASNAASRSVFNDAPDVASGAASRVLVATDVPPTGSAVTVRDQLVGVLSNAGMAAPLFLTIETSIPVDPALISQTPVVLIGSGQSLVDQYARIRPAPQAAPTSFIVPIDAEGCGSRPTKFAPGTRCISRGIWLASGARGQAFREDAAAAGIVPSWITTIAYDGGGLLASLLDASTATSAATSVAEMRSRLLGAQSLPLFAQFEGINGRLIPGQGYENDAQTLIAADGEWQADPVSR